MPVFNFYTVIKISFWGFFNISLLNFTGFQYKVLHKLQEILEEIKKQGEINELPDSTYFINQMSDLEGFNEFDKGLNDICQHTRLVGFSIIK